MSMLFLLGQVLNVFDTPASTDRATGEVRPAKSRVQVMAENELQNGQKRHELVNLSVDDPDLYRKLIGHTVSVPVGAFVASGAVMFYALKGQRPTRQTTSGTGAVVAAGAVATAAAAAATAPVSRPAG